MKKGILSESENTISYSMYLLNNWDCFWPYCYIKILGSQGLEGYISGIGKM